MSHPASPDDATERVIEQRVRNRIMEELAYLARGEAAVREIGCGDYIYDFFTWFPEEGPPHGNSALTKAEFEVLSELLPMMQQMLRELPIRVGDQALIATGWPERIAPIAQRALSLFVPRGRFKEDVEEREPTS
jgi:hypothetical protein